MAFGLFKKKTGEEKKSSTRSGYLSLTVKEVVKETADAISIHFHQPEEAPIQYKSGQFFTIIADINGKEERRAYSLCSSPFVDEHPAVAVKRVDGGLMSNYLGDHLKAGDSLKLMEPIGNFVTEFNPSNSRHLVLFGGGSGITPLISIAKSALDQEPNSKVSLVYANRNVESIIFKTKLDVMQSANPDRFKVWNVLESKPVDFVGDEGYLTQEIIKNALSNLPQFAPESTEFFMCGPGPMMDVVTSSLNNLGIDKSRVHKESFTTSESKKEESTQESDEIIAREVTIIYDDEEYKYTVEPGESILEKGLEEDIDLPFSCQSGLCTACRGKCTSGKVKMDEDEGLSEAEINEGFVLPCVSHPMSDDVVIVIG